MAGDGEHGGALRQLHLLEHRAAHDLPGDPQRRCVWSAAGGAVGVVAAVLIVVVFAFALSWVFTTLGMLLRSPNAVMNAGFMALFPLVFLSNTLVDPSTLPSWLEAFVDVNPISILSTASRSLMDGDPDWGAIGISLAVAAALAAVFLPITTRLYRSR